MSGSWILALALVALTASAAETARYVAPDGNDAWSGTVPAPNEGGGRTGTQRPSGGAREGVRV